MLDKKLDFYSIKRIIQVFDHGETTSKIVVVDKITDADGNVHREVETLSLVVDTATVSQVKKTIREQFDEMQETMRYMPDTYVFPETEQ